MKKHELSRQIADALDYLSPATDNVLNTMAIMDAVDAYADARESNVIAELKASLSQAQQMYTDLLVGTTDAIVAKDAEIKRMREGVASVMDRFNFPTEARDRLNGLLSPAPVTEEDDYQKEDQFIFSLGERLKATHQGFEGCSDQWYRVARTAIEIYKNEDQE